MGKERPVANGDENRTQREWGNFWFRKMRKDKTKVKESRGIWGPDITLMLSLLN